MTKIVSFYCDTNGETFYQSCAQSLIKSCERVGNEYLIVHRNFGNSWIDNVKAKPIFLLEMLNELNDDFLWLDVDCIVHKKIDFSTNPKWGIDYRGDGTPHDYVHYVPNIPRAKDFMNLWINEIERCGGGSHSSFINIYNTMEVEKIPDGYFSLVCANVKSKNDYFNK